MDSDLLTAQEVAALLRVDRSTVSKYATDGRLPSFKTPGGHLRFRRSDIEALFGTAPEMDGAA